MMFKGCVLVFGLVLLVVPIVSAGGEPAAQESDQQISDFSLAGYAEKGQKSWDLAGKTADIFEDVVKLKKVVGNLYGATEDVNITADKGDFDKKEGKVHLEKDVVITTSSGAKLTTDSLNWDRKAQTVSTEDKVNIEKENMVTVAKGAVGQPNLSKVNLQKDVQVEIKPAEPKAEDGKTEASTIITCDGPLEIDYQKNLAIFKNNVQVDNEGTTINADIMDVYFSRSTNEAKEKEEKEEGAQKGAPPSLAGSKIEKVIARGNVKITKGQNVSYSDEATYVAIDKKVILTGRPKLMIYSTEDFKGVF